MRYRTINIYSINDKGNHLYEYSTITKDTIKEVLIKHVKNDNTDDKLTKTSLHFKHLQNNCTWKQDNIVSIYGSIS